MVIFKVLCSVPLPPTCQGCWVCFSRSAHSFLVFFLKNKIYNSQAREPLILLERLSSKDCLCSDVSPFQDCSFSTVGGFLWAYYVTSKGKERTDTVVGSDSCDPSDFRQEPARLLCPWGFSRQEHCSELPFPSPGDLRNPGVEPWSLAFLVVSLSTEPPGKFW